MTIEASMSLFDESNWDAFVPQRWQDGEFTISAERDGKLYWACFNGNPAYFCAEVTAIGWEDFLRDGPPVETSPSCSVAIRRYFELCRTDGRSTHVLLGMRHDAEPVCGSWIVDGFRLALPDIPGPDGAGLGAYTDLSSFRGRCGDGWERALIRPGQHSASVTITRADGTECTKEQRFVARAGARSEVIFDVAQPSGRRPR
jgi:hypothetical protein